MWIAQFVFMSYWKTNKLMTYTQLSVLIFIQFKTRTCRPPPKIVTDVRISGIVLTFSCLQTSNLEYWGWACMKPRRSRISDFKFQNSVTDMLELIIPPKTFNLIEESLDQTTITSVKKLISNFFISTKSNSHARKLKNQLAQILKVLQCCWNSNPSDSNCILLLSTE